ncbi:nascent polypeptide-associated complex subunit alpha [Drosophila teissieri]|uniref:nascent polypeptide-associated complex subunit alpha n=1 Tax=Drosophila teissieri TaxID=7243 RepID=UPI001CBA4DF1|nr:nascent polypeptide-associated complex subunit alpha [Drosophila teissieri]
MGKKQKMKKAAQVAAQMATAAAQLQTEVATKEKSTEDATPAPCCSGKKQKPKETQRTDVAKGVQKELAKLEEAVDEAKKQAPPGFSGAKGKPHIMGHMDPAYRSKIKRLMSLAQQLPPNVFNLQSPQQEKRPSAEDSSADEDDRSTDSDDAPDLVEADRKAAQPDELGELGALGTLAVRGPGDGPKHSRGEKKARRILMKLDLKPVENVARVTMKKSKNILLYIDQPDVFRVAHSQTYIFFGEIRVEDISSSATASQAAAKAAERFRGTSPVGGQDDKADVKAPGGPSLADEDDEDDGDDVDVDDKGLDVKDIELVQMQAACSRKKAIQALLKNDNDVVNAIMALTVG